VFACCPQWSRQQSTSRRCACGECSGRPTRQTYSAARAQRYSHAFKATVYLASPESQAGRLCLTWKPLLNETALLTKAVAHSGVGQTGEEMPSYEASQIGWPMIRTMERVESRVK
jgi:hypothetical protein